MFEVAKLETSVLYLNKDQTHFGRSILAFNNHKTELFELTRLELNHFAEDLSKAAKALQNAFDSQKINYAVYGDVVSHLHFHLVPKYENSVDWGDAFVHAPQEIKKLKNSEYEYLIEKIQQHLKTEEVNK